MGFFSKLFGGGQPAEPSDAPVEREAPPDALVVLRQGMNVPGEDYVAGVLAAAFGDLPSDVPRFALAQPVWFKKLEIAEAAAADVAAAFGRKLSLGETTHRYRTVEGPDGSHVMIVEVRRA
jgi:hypothetical protein